MAVYSRVKMATNCKLEELNLSHCCNISDDMVQEIVSQTRFRCSVTRLNMHGVYLSQDAFDMTVTLPHLSVLELFDTERVNDTTLRRVSIYIERSGVCLWGVGVGGRCVCVCVCVRACLHVPLSKDEQRYLFFSTLCTANGLIRYPLS